MKDIDKTDYETVCVYCKRKFTTKSWIEPKGMLKGFRILEDMYCSPMCKSTMKYILDNIK